ncbi:hypothetical protein LXL04_030160 [Taraxacum kok-saghyz]
MQDILVLVLDDKLLFTIEGTPFIPPIHSFPNFCSLLDDKHATVKKPQPSSEKGDGSSILGSDSGGRWLAYKILHMTVAERIGLVWEGDALRRPPRGGVEQTQWDALMERLSNVTLLDRRDRLGWAGDESDSFSVGSARRCLDSRFLFIGGEETSWNSWIPIKLNVFLWRVMDGGLPTRERLSRRGILLDSMLCPVCNDQVESIPHILTGCSQLFEIWARIAIWWGVALPNSLSLADLLAWPDATCLSANARKAFQAFIVIAMWVLWNHRNKMVFGSQSSKKAVIFDDVVDNSLLGTGTQRRPRVLGGTRPRRFSHANTTPALNGVVVRRNANAKERGRRILVDIFQKYRLNYSLYSFILSHLRKKEMDLQSLCQIRVGDGLRTRFWYDRWLGQGPLLETFPRVFLLDLHQHMTIAERIGLGWEAGRPSIGGVEQTQWDALMERLSNVTLLDRRDRLGWAGDESDSFSVGSARRWLDSRFLFIGGEETSWNSWIPIKLNVFLWRVMGGGLPTRERLSRRGILLDSILCPVCNDQVESIPHILTGCSQLFEIWARIAIWWGVALPNSLSLADLLAWPDATSLSANARKAFQAVIVIAMWVLWNHRNKMATRYGYTTASSSPRWHPATPFLPREHHPSLERRCRASERQREGTRASSLFCPLNG